MRILFLATLLAGCSKDDEVVDTDCGIPVCEIAVWEWHDSTVCLTGTARCVQGDPTFTWSLPGPEVTPPADTGSGETDGNSAVSTVCFVLDAVVEGTYLAILVVSDGAETTDPCVGLVAVTSGNDPPVASCDPPEDGRVGDYLEFDGSDSYDPEGARLSYDWSLGSAPKGSLLTTDDIYNHTSVKAILVPDAAGTWTLTLVVGDGQSTSDPCQASVEVEL